MLEELRGAGTLSEETRRRLARAAFAHTAAYDAAIVAWLDDGEVLPPTVHLTLERAEVLRYGENPHQQGARYRIGGQPSWWDQVVQHAGGKALSYLNIFDADAAWRLVHELAADADAVGSGPDVAPGGGDHQARQPPAGRPWRLTFPPPTSGPSSATRPRPSGASWPSAAR